MTTEPYSDTYQEFIADQIRTWNYRRFNKEVIALREIIDVLDLTANNTAVRDWVIEQKVAKPRDWDKSLREKRLIAHFGFVPRLARELVKWYIDTHHVAIHYGGEVREGRDDYGTNIEQLKRSIRLVRDEHMLVGISDSQISDAADDHYDKALRERVPAVLETIGYRPEVNAEPHWQAILSAGWGSDLTPEFIRGVLTKFVWQVKRKMQRKSITNHLMPVLTGRQRCGKSTFNEMFTSPLTELRASSNFQQIADDRNIDLWKHFVIVMPEMSKAGVADADQVKSVITADTLDRRPMRSNATVKVRQQATLIGDANRSLAELFNDSTGLRRYAELYFTGANREVLNTVDWRAIWRSVDENAVDPSEAIMEQLEVQQEGARHRSLVEDWMDLADHKFIFREGRYVTAEVLWENFLGFADKYSPKHFYTAQGFKKELARLTIDDAGWHKKRGKRGMLYFRGDAPPHSALVIGLLQDDDPLAQSEKPAVLTALDVIRNRVKQTGG